jgi:cytochrome b561
MLMGHSSIGAMVSLLVLIRVTKRFIVRSPIPKHDLAPLQAAAAKGVQYALYLCMVLIPITGILTAQQHELPVNMFGTFNVSGAPMSGYDEATFLTFRSLHVLAINSFIFILVGHIGAALFHGLVKKDGVLRSMLPSRKKSKASDVNTAS